MDKIGTYTRLSPEVREALEQVAEEDNRSLSRQLEHIVELYLEERRGKPSRYMTTKEMNQLSKEQS